MTPQRNWLALEISLVSAIVVFGHVFQYWLSTVLPFDASEFAVLSEASAASRNARIHLKGA